MRALVTGGSGFIGQHVIQELMTRAEISDIICASRREPERDSSLEFYDTAKRRTLARWRMDVENEKEVHETIYFWKPGIIFHLAANPLVKENSKSPCAISRINILGTHHLLAHAKPGTRFVYVSSATVYGGGAMPVWENSPTNPKSVYAATKLAGEQLVAAYQNLGRVNALVARLTANVGPGATHGVLPDLVRKINSGSPELELLGDEPGSSKPYTYVKDTARFLVEAGLDQNRTGIVNVAAQGSVSICLLADLVMQTLGIWKPKKWLGANANWPGDDKVLNVNTIADRFSPSFEFPTSSQAIVQAAKDAL